MPVGRSLSPTLPNETAAVKRLTLYCHEGTRDRPEERAPGAGLLFSFSKAVNCMKARIFGGAKDFRSAYKGRQPPESWI